MRTILRPPLQARANSGITFRPDANTKLWLPGQDDAFSSTIRDRSGNGNNGAITGPSWERNDQGLWYLDFVTDDKIVVSHSAELNPGTNWTLSVWVRPDALTATMMVANKENLTTSTPSYYLRRTDAVSEWHFALSDDAGNTGVQAVADSLTPVGSWHLFHCVKRNTVLELYLDGVLKDNNTVSGLGSLTGTGELWFGYDLRSQNPLNGGIALERSHNIAFSANEAAQQMAQERHLFGR